MMDKGPQENSIDILLKELRENHKQTIVSQEDYQKAEKRINSEMETFSIEQRAYFNRSVQAASKAYLTF